MRRNLLLCAIFLLLLLLAWPQIVDSAGRVLYLFDQGQVGFYETRGNGSNRILLQAPSSLASDYTFTWPSDDGTNGQFLSTDGNGVFSWGNNSTASLDSSYENGASVTVDAGAITLTGSGTILDIEGSTTIRGPIPFVDVTAYGTDATAFNSAISTLSGGGILYIPAGTYTIASQITIDGDDIQIIGAGPDAVLSSSSGVTMIYGEGRSNVTIKDLSFVLNNDARAIGLDGGASGTTTDWTIMNVDIFAQTTNGASGIRLSSEQGTATVTRVKVLNCRIRSDRSVPTADGLSVGGGQNTMSDIFIDNVLVDGFDRGFNTTNNGSGDDNSLMKISNSTFKNAYTYGARLYHGGRAIVSNCLFEGNEVGAYLDNGSNNQRTVVIGCRFVDNDEIGAFTEEWKSGVITGCLFTGNGDAGLWLCNAQETVVTGCTISDNGDFGLLTDDDATFTGTNSGETYQISHGNGNRDVTISGCSISNNGDHGITVEGTGRTFTIEGCVITRNGQDSGGPASSSGYANVYLDDDGGTSNSGVVRVIGCAIGNPSGGNGGSSDGMTQYGIVANTGTITQIQIVGNHFSELEDAIQLDQSTSALKVVTNNVFQGCNDIVLTGGRIVFWGNTMDSGTLDGSAWDGYWGMGANQGNVEFQEAVDLESTLTVDGASTLTGAVTAQSTLGVTGAATLSSTLAVTGVTTLGTGLTAASSINTLSINVLTPLDLYIAVAAESGTSDGLSTINTGANGKILVLEPDAGDTITVNETGNIDLGATTRVLDSVEDKLMLIHNGTSWCEIAFTNNG